MALRMSLALLILLTALIHHGTRARRQRTYFVRADELRDYPDKCFDGERCHLHAIGESWTVDEVCERATCTRASNGTLVERRTGCEQPPPLINEKCYIVRVQGRSYPDCCSQLYCNGKLVSYSLP
ncbi:U-scoloptoxin(16)-Cw1a-like [Oratosquilla oratoria]|uniref:U-scoloptoxin(16)-Cw1a-like n=1 Tax=Oratosquilla oratoria TaxID=337810 RepID=UPI003F76367D